mmetsp:Transcript_63095/g.186423  ORF Transcript_63095/g.186423 Transcript_63095/m.186423 type:complete len:351 (-) Transcript_63095:336-1388(-)
MKLSPPRHHVLVRRLSLLDLKGDVAVQFLEQPLADHAGSEEFALASRKRTFVHSEGHADGRLLDSDGGKRISCINPTVLVRDEGVTDLDIFEPGKHDDLPRRRLFHLLLAEIVEDEKLRKAPRLLVLPRLGERDLLSCLDGPLSNPRDAHLPLEVVVDNVGDEALEVVGFCRLDLGWVNRLHDRVEKGLHVIGHIIGLKSCLSLQAGRVHNLEVGLLVARPQLHEQVEGLVDDIVRPRGGSVDLVHDKESLHPFLEGLVEDEPSLGLGALHTVHHEQDAVGHVEDALDLPAEVGVARRVHDVDLDAVAHDCKILRKDGDSTLPLLVLRVHDALPGLVSLGLVPEDACLAD